MIARVGVLLDSNIIIYALQPAYPQVREFVSAHRPVVSAASYVEVLGYHRLADADRRSLERFFASTRVLPLDRPVIDRDCPPPAAPDVTRGFTRRRHCAGPRPDFSDAQHG